jgi:hypothetical protein
MLRAAAFSPAPHAVKVEREAVIIKLIATLRNCIFSPKNYLLNNARLFSHEK